MMDEVVAWIMIISGLLGIIILPVIFARQDRNSQA